MFMEIIEFVNFRTDRSSSPGGATPSSFDLDENRKYNVLILYHWERHVIKKLTKHGNSWALIIDKPVLELLDIDPETPLQISTDGETLIIAPVRDPERRAKFRAALEKTNKKYAHTLKRLAH